MRNKVAILYICTGEYVVFWEGFYRSFKANFLKNSDVQYFVFTDSREIPYMNEKDVHLYYTQKKEWPYGTLLRFHIFHQAEAELRKFDYCFFMNANLICMQEINEDEFLPTDEELLVVRHPGTYVSTLDKFLFERNPKSTAYIPEGMEQLYVCGGINGGKSCAYMDMAKELSRRIDEDLNNNIIAVVHDESHINRYILEHTNYRLLGGEYIYPEGWVLPLEQKIIVLNKSHVFNVSQLKNSNKGISFDDYQMVLRSKERYELYYGITRQLLYCKRRGEVFSDFLKGRDIHNIAIYGYKNLGEILLDEISDSDITVKYIIDNRLTTVKENIKVIKGDEIEEICDVDCIIITALMDFYLIYKDLISKVQCPVYSLEFLIHEMYMKYIQD
jgi:hypothetical protein